MLVLESEMTQARDVLELGEPHTQLSSEICLTYQSDVMYVDSASKILTYDVLLGESKPRGYMTESTDNYTQEG